MYFNIEKNLLKIVISIIKQLLFFSNEEPYVHPILSSHTCTVILVIIASYFLNLLCLILPFVKYFLCLRHCARNSCLLELLRSLEIIAIVSFCIEKAEILTGKVTCAVTPLNGSVQVQLIVVAFSICHSAFVCVCS